MSKLSLDRVMVERRPITRAGDPIVVEMPFPPSVNELFGQSPGKQRFPSAKYKAWQKAVKWQFTIDPPPRMSGPVHLLFEFAERDNRQRDVSNYIKSAEDALVHYGIIEGDHSKIVRAIEAKWSQGMAGVRITIEPAKLARAA